ncbi:GlxA family transcriptional regulator [Pseudomarimonas salicorniae]|uniref:Helix-turn-helix domain-containing protein n=1 Tax=Pseudomarimonas salicorniae TaxID=2933270 RepID=A0ABT0GCQ5_9GAMM|nr:helix-turn-helix domain-containing protein [Lysobacter sp. CAU 1642]MCK7592313.1 helix-turn-helix domain-containing protein [Lysobacter sp. CAU 1642]
MSTPVLLALLPGTLLLDLAGIAEPLRIANDLCIEAGQPAPFALGMLGAASEVRSSLPLRLVDCEPYPSGLPGSADSPAWVILVGTASRLPIARGEREAAERALIGWLRRVVAPAIETGRARLWTVCAGALMAGRAGLFDGRRCTTHHDHVEALRQGCPQAQVLDDRLFVIDGPVASSAGITAGIDLALEAIRQRAGVELANRVARELVVYRRRAGGDPQLSPLLDHRNHLHAAVHRAQEAVLADPAADWSIERLASAAHVSARHLRRLFHAHAGIAPLHYVQRMRLALLRQWREDAGASAEVAAQRAGFSSARQARDAARQLAGLGLG